MKSRLSCILPRKSRKNRHLSILHDKACKEHIDTPLSKNLNLNRKFLSHSVMKKNSPVDEHSDIVGIPATVLSFWQAIVEIDDSTLDSRYGTF